MQMQEIRVLAKAYDIKTSRISKAELIRTIQRQEGNFDCFGSALDGYCDQGGCLWRGDCITVPTSKS